MMQAYLTLYKSILPCLDDWLYGKIGQTYSIFNLMHCTGLRYCGILPVEGKYGICTDKLQE